MTQPERNKKIFVGAQLVWPDDGVTGVVTEYPAIHPEEGPHYDAVQVLWTDSLDWELLTVEEVLPLLVKEETEE